ncbi:sugar phosphate isomerase/epimerase [Rhizobium sp. BK251]|uniref:sugar phosphate isomerase/epimerase family protein n=1 Tax=Rhizobium sp. BK251 TaxID=2512125 RepID=UPI00104660F7|nr:sugar phosphate isomerase/epimerase [Rhizobium sp. BK251]TCL71035.1 sugar phosphate isomerase/epimerase [Rhizobium sp. BK251]
MTYKIAFQLYSSRNFPPVEPQLEKLAALGHDGVEPFLPNYEADPSGFRAQLDNVGLKCFGFHLPYDELVADPARFADIAHTLGSDLLIPPWLAPEQRPQDADGWRRIGASLRKVADSLAGQGLRLAWHNHDFEYVALPDGAYPIDHLLEAAGPGVGFEADFAWVTRAGVDPVEALQRHADRILAIQVKDTKAAGVTEEAGWAAMGDGIIDWSRLWPLFSTTRTDHVVVEHDDPKDWFETAKRSIEFIKSMKD